jgi:hypothetical protein
MEEERGIADGAWAVWAFDFPFRSLAVVSASPLLQSNCGPE